MGRLRPEERALVKRMEKTSELHGATYIVYFARSRKTRVAHRMVEVRLLEHRIGDICACATYTPSGRLYEIGVRTHTDDPLHRIAAKLADATGTTIQSYLTNRVGTYRAADQDYEYLAEQPQREHAVTIEEARILAKASRKTVSKAVRRYLLNEDRPPHTTLLTKLDKHS